MAHDRIRRAGPAGDPARLEEDLAFLAWMGDGHFVFLGARSYDYPREPDGSYAADEPQIVPDSSLGVLRDPRRVLSQKIYSFKFDDKRGIVETLYQLVEPLRWRDGQLNKDVFSSIDTEDVQAEGCQLLWKKKDADFVATHDPKVCPDPPGATPTQVEFSAGVLTVGEYKFRKLH